jgi:hypothetical protein
LDFSLQISRSSHNRSVVPISNKSVTVPSVSFHIWTCCFIVCFPVIVIGKLIQHNIASSATFLSA